MNTDIGETGEDMANEDAVMSETPVLPADAPTETAEDDFADQSGQHMRILEALLFASDGPLDGDTLNDKLPEGADVGALIASLAERYANRGVNLVAVGGGWAFRTAPDLAPHLTVYRTVKRRLSRAAMETLAIIAYHQPVTRAEVEEIRGVGLSRGTLDLLLEAGWVKPKGRRRVPGRPLTWVTTDDFLEHFGIDSVADLPGVEELKAAGLLQANPVSIGATGELSLDDPLGESFEDDIDYGSSDSGDTEEDPYGEPQQETREDDTERHDSQSE